ncbi:MAG: 50S ribosomal protein L15 [Chitinophagaceae bacterium]|nr:50S ribosomal protein L15 [Chitinophagaceae bacterium]
MNLHQLRPAKGATKKEKRIGRGEASGKGGTSTKGNKGHQATSGFKNRRSHEGGQMPIQRRIPKRGFKNPHRIEYKVFNLGQVEHLVAKYDLKEFSLESLYVNGLASRTDRVKLLGVGELKTKVAFKINAISDKAKSAVEAAGGSVEILK